MIVFVFFLTVLTVFLVQSYFQRKKFYKFADNIPSPPTFGFLGHAPYFLGKDEQGWIGKFGLWENWLSDENSKNNFRSTWNASSVVSRAKDIHKIMVGSSHHVDDRKWPKNHPKNSSVPRVSREAVLL